MVPEHFPVSQNASSSVAIGGSSASTSSRGMPALGQRAVDGEAVGVGVVAHGAGLPRGGGSGASARHVGRDDSLAIVASVRDAQHRRVFTSLHGYQRAWAGADLVAGLTLLVIAVPEQLATSRLAGMPPITGFYAFVAGTVLFALLGSNPQMSVGADSTIAPLFAAGRVRPRPQPAPRTTSTWSRSWP